MSDTRLRDLERRWQATGAVEDEAAYRLRVAHDVMLVRGARLENDRPINDDARRALLGLLRVGLLSVRAAAERGDALRCEMEADHLHNIPSILEANSLTLLLHYWEVERPAFVRNVARTDVAIFEPYWTEVERCVRELRPQMTRADVRPPDGEQPLNRPGG